MADPMIITYAQLAERAYVEDAYFLNKPLIPWGWTVLYETPIQPSGFQAGVYTDGGEIVIAFAGTSGPLTGPLDLSFNDDWIADRQLFSGIFSEQLYDAARLYLQVKSGMYGDVGSREITFTGHSLGGGLASLMSALFGEKSTCFAMGPFEKALNGDVIGTLASRLAGEKS